MKIKPWLYAFFLIDFSGSMDQIIEGQSKQKVVKDSVSSYLQAISNQSQVDVIVFGLNPKKSCEDFTAKSLSPNEAALWLQGLKPGPYGKTPLAEGISRMGLAVKKEGHRNAIIITDGADTCGLDACAELRSLDQQLKGAVGKLRLDIIGFDTQADRRFDCFKDLKSQLSRIDLAVYDAGNRLQLMNPLIENQKHDKLKPGMAAVMVAGAPPSAEFKLSSPDKASGTSISSWVGEYRVQQPPGKYIIQTQEKDAQPLSVSLFSGDNRIIPYGDFFKLKHGKLHLQSSGLGLRLKPHPDTIKAHPSAQEFSQEKLSEISSSQEGIKLFFGKWTLTVLDPWWLNGAVEKEFVISRNENLQLHAADFLSEVLSWIDTSTLNEPGVIGLDQHKILIMPGTRRLPYKKGWNTEWLAK